MSTVDTFFSQHWQGEIPVDIQRLAGHAGLFFEQCTFEDTSIVSTLRYEQQRWIGSLSKDSSLLRKRFAAAHQLARILQGSVSDMVHIQRVSSFSTTDHGVEGLANRAALDLLIPTRALHFAMNNKKMHFADLCATFGVSQAAMATKLQQCIGITGPVVQESLEF